MAIGRAGGDIGAIDIVSVGNDYIIRDITVSSASSAHGQQIVEAVKDVDGVELVHVSDPTFLMHLGGKIEVVSKVPLKTALISPWLTHRELLASAKRSTKILTRLLL
jgi:malate dehydrogenase (oxaloacetate-decarboxylating)